MSETQAPMARPACANCPHWKREALGRGTSVGFCAAEPPKVIPRWVAKSADYRGVFPETVGHQVCGRHPLVMAQVAYQVEQCQLQISYSQTLGSHAEKSNGGLSRGNAG